MLLTEKCEVFHSECGFGANAVKENPRKSIKETSHKYFKEVGRFHWELSTLAQSNLTAGSSFEMSPLTSIEKRLC